MSAEVTWAGMESGHGSSLYFRRAASERKVRVWLRRDVRIANAAAQIGSRMYPYPPSLLARHPFGSSDLAVLQGQRCASSARPLQRHGVKE
jgi:hypothetical protein